MSAPPRLGARLWAAGVARGAALLASLRRLGSPSPQPEPRPSRRAPSPAELGLDDDPIVAALGLGRGSDAGPRRRGRADPARGDDPPT